MKNLDIAKKRIFYRETEFILIAEQNNAAQTHYMKAKIDKMQQNSKCRLCVNRDKTLNHISECRKLAQKQYKTRHEWVGKVIYWELCKKLKFDHTARWYMQKPESVLENETHKILWARRPDLVIVNNKKENLSNIGLSRSGQSENQIKRKKRQLDLAREVKKLWNIKVTVMLIVIGALRTIPQVSIKVLEDLEIGG